MKTHSRSGRTALALAALLASTLAGCRAAAGTQNTYRVREGSYEIETVKGNPQLYADLALVNVRSNRNADGRLMVQFDLVSQRTSQLAVEWMVEWFDASGFLVEQPVNWKPLIVGPKGVETLKINAPAPGADSWRLGLRQRNEIH